MAVLTASGITFGDGTSASGRASFSFPAATVTVFYKQTAPTGWTAVAGQNDKMLRLVSQASAAGGAAAGTNSFSTALSNRPVSQTVSITINGLSAGPVSLDTNTIPPHSHAANNGGNTSASPGGGATVVNPGTTTGSYGNGGAHTHPATYTSASGPWSSSVDMSVQYCDVILCSFNG